jgi:hypothetical protein
MISARRAFHAAALRTGRPFAITSGSGRVYGGTFASS